VIVRQARGKGEILVSTIDFFKLGNQAKFMVRNMVSNLGGAFEGKVLNIPEGLNEEGVLENALFLGSIQFESPDTSMIFKNNPLAEKEFAKVKIGTETSGIFWDIATANKDGIFDFIGMNLKEKEYALAYLSFWVYSPRSLTDLLIEPDMPRLDMHFGVDDAMAFSVNGKSVKEYIRMGTFAEDQYIYEGLPLEKGWNHMLIKVAQGTAEWKCKVRFSSTKPDFMKDIKTVVDR
nr:hypothetical protein [Bacteroidales bacterium]